MKAIYTDRFSLIPSFWLVLSIWNGFKAATEPYEWDTWIRAAIAVLAFAAAYQGFARRVRARRRGEDPSIIKVVDRA
jgi:hypothetical protein